LRLEAPANSAAAYIGMSGRDGGFCAAIFLHWVTSVRGKSSKHKSGWSDNVWAVLRVWTSLRQVAREGYVTEMMHRTSKCQVCTGPDKKIKSVKFYKLFGTQPGQFAVCWTSQRVATNRQTY